MLEKCAEISRFSRKPYLLIIICYFLLEFYKQKAEVNLFSPRVSDSPIQSPLMSVQRIPFLVAFEPDVVKGQLGICRGCNWVTCLEESLDTPFCFPPFFITFSIYIPLRVM